MNKKQKIAVATSLSLLLMGNVFAKPNQQDIKIKINGNDVISDVAPFVDNNRTLVPIRVISENLGYNVNWDNQTQKVTVKNDNKVVELTIGKKDVNINGNNSSIDVAPMIKNNRTFVPLRFISESFGNDVKWDNDSRVVKIDKKIAIKSDITNNTNKIINNNPPKEKPKEQYVDYSEHNRKVVEDYYRQQNNNNNNYSRPIYTPEVPSKPQQNTYVSDDEILRNIRDNVKINTQVIEAQTVSGVDLVGTLQNNTNYTIKSIYIDILLPNGKLAFYNTDNVVQPYGSGTLSVSNNISLMGVTSANFHNSQLMSVDICIILPSGEERLVYTQNDDVVNNFVF